LSNYWSGSRRVCRTCSYACGHTQKQDHSHCVNRSNSSKKNVFVYRSNVWQTGRSARHWRARRPWSYRSTAGRASRRRRRAGPAGPALSAEQRCETRRTPRATSRRTPHPATIPARETRRRRRRTRTSNCRSQRKNVGAIGHGIVEIHPRGG